MGYDGNAIDVLEGLESVRMNPGMYIGSTGSRGLHHLAYELIDNCVDEALAGRCSLIDVIIHKNGSMTVKDNGDGIPVGINKKAGVPAINLVFGKLHAGGKFGQGTYKVSGGLHGVGASVVNAFSKTLDCRVFKNKKEYSIKYKDQDLIQPLKEHGKTSKQGTSITFLPDKTIFTTVDFKFNIIKTRLRELAFLNKGLEFTLRDERMDEIIEETYKFDGGIGQYISKINESKTLIHKDVISFTGTREVSVKNSVRDHGKVRIETVNRNIIIDIAMQYTSDYRENIYSFVNNIPTIDGGTHLSGFKTAITKAINEYCRRTSILKAKDANFLGTDTIEGLTAIVSVKLEYRPEFEGQTKSKLGNPEVRSAVQSYVTEFLEEYFETNKDLADHIAKKVELSQKARNISKKAREAAKATSNPKRHLDKLADATSRDRSKCEIYIVEGDSAGGSAKLARNKTTQAVLPSRGKSVNVEKKSYEKVLENKEIQILDASIGVGMGYECDVSKCRYGKIILLPDADVDGGHIKNLNLTYFYKFKRALIEAGIIYIAMPPLYKVKTNKQTVYIYDDAELVDFRKDLKRGEKILELQRYKGLGEMDAKQLQSTCMDPATRKLKRVYIEDQAYAEQLVSTFMGLKAEPRYNYLMKHIKNYDI